MHQWTAENRAADPRVSLVCQDRDLFKFVHSMARKETPGTGKQAGIIVEEDCQ